MPGDIIFETGPVRDPMDGFYTGSINEEIVNQPIIDIPWPSSGSLNEE
jgi:hypothetical protein